MFSFFQTPGNSRRFLAMQALKRLMWIKPLASMRRLQVYRFWHWLKIDAHAMQIRQMKIFL
jgi:hypothetical protein